MFGQRLVSILIVDLIGTLICGDSAFAQDHPARQQQVQVAQNDGHAAASPPIGTNADRRGLTNGRYTVWVFKLADGKWQKQEERTIKTDNEDLARSYMESVQAVRGWTATSNLPAKTNGKDSSGKRRTASVEGTTWVYAMSTEGSSFRFDSGNILRGLLYREPGTWRQDGDQVTMEIPYGGGAGPNVFKGVVDPYASEIRCVVESSPNPHNVGVQFTLVNLKVVLWQNLGTPLTD